MTKTSDYNILICDDDEAIRYIAELQFKREGFNTFSASGGKEALEVLKTNKIDLVLSDIRMPKGDGIFLVEEIRKINKTTPIVILMTGYTEVSEPECLEKGASMVLLKPYDPRALIPSVFKLLNIQKNG